MKPAERATQLFQSHDAFEAARTLCSEHDVDLNAEMERLNALSPELGLGEHLMAALVQWIEGVWRRQLLPTPHGELRLLTSDRFSEGRAMQSLRDKVTDLYVDNAQRAKAGAYAHLLDRTVSHIERLAQAYGSREEAYGARRKAMEWLAGEARNRGLGPDDPLSNAFTLADLQESIAASSGRLRTALELQRDTAASAAG